MRRCAEHQSKDSGSRDQGLRNLNMTLETEIDNVSYTSFTLRIGVLLWAFLHRQQSNVQPPTVFSSHSHMSSL